MAAKKKKVKKVDTRKPYLVRFKSLSGELQVKASEPRMAVSLAKITLVFMGLSTKGASFTVIDD